MGSLALLRGVSSRAAQPAAMHAAHYDEAIWAPYRSWAPGLPPGPACLRIGARQQTHCYSQRLRSPVMVPTQLGLHIPLCPSYESGARSARQPA